MQSVMQPPIRRPNELAHYLIATFAWSWACWLPAVPQFRAHGISGAPGWCLGLLLLGSYGPSLMALFFAARSDGRAGVKRLLGRLARWRIGGRWLALALLLPTLVTLAALALYAAFGGALGDPSLSRAHLLPLAFLAAIPFGPLAEELGWRGFALPRLLERYHPFTASLAIGAAWTFWHTPLFFAPAGTSISGGPINPLTVGGYLALLVGYSVFFTRLHLATVDRFGGGSVLAAVLLHASFNADLVYLFLPELSAEQGRFVELLGLVPLWLLVALVVLTGRLKGPGAPPSD